MSACVAELGQSPHTGIRYRVLTELLDVSDCDAEAGGLREATWASKDVQRMLARQGADGIWDHAGAKEYGVHTSLRYLTACAEHGLGRDPRLDGAAAHAVRFLMEKEDAEVHADYSGCSSALVLRALVMLGYHDEPGVQELLARYVAAQLADGGFICRRLLAQRPDRKSCFRAALAALLLYAECVRQGAALPGVDRLLDYFLRRDVFYHAEDLATLVVDGRPGWRAIDNFFPVEAMRIGLPLTLAALAVLGAGREPALDRAWALLGEKRNARGWYVLEGTLAKQPCKWGKMGQENDWITFYALLAEKHADAGLGGSGTGGETGQKVSSRVFEC
jgi:hypothetical protein